MSASPARHRVMRVDMTDAAEGFWAAKRLVDPADSPSAPKHARKAPARYALNIGRVGALAVSLGIGLAIANASTGTAYAETDADSSSKATPAASSNSPDPKGDEDAKTTPQADNDEAADDDVDDDVKDVIEPDDDPDATNVDIDTKDIDTKDIDTDDIDDGAPGADVESVALDAVANQGDATGDTIIDEETSSPAAPAPLGAVLPIVASGTSTAPPAPSPARKAVSGIPAKAADADVVGAVVSSVVAPLTTSSQAASPVTNVALAWLRRILSHTFANKTPVVNSVNVTTFLGIATITIDAYDPNGDPLTYEIVSGSGPANGLVVPGIIPGTFIYTPNPLKLLQGQVQDTFTVKIRDDSEHLTGALGGIQRLLEGLARAFGFAQRDNFDQVVNVTVDPVIDLPGAPPLVVVTGGATYRLGSPGVKPLTSVSITDVDSDYVKGATVTVTKTDVLSPSSVSGDILNFTDTEKITGSYNASTGVLTLTGTATEAEYEAALASVTFTATQVIDGLLGIGTVGRTVTVVVTDSSGVPNALPAFALMSVEYALPGAKPVVSLSGSTPTFVLGKGAVAALTSVSISDSDSTKLSGAKVTVTASPLLLDVFIDGDTLTFSDTDKIVGSYNSGTGVLTLTGVATLAEYQAALQSISFSATDGGGLIFGAPVDRTITVTVTDDGATRSTSNADSATVKVARPVPPTVSLSGASPTFIFGRSPVTALPSVVIADSDSAMLSGAKVTVQGLTLGVPSGHVTGDVLGFVNGNGISMVSNSGGVLTLTGNATLAAYQAALQSITFSATQPGGLLDLLLDRRITVTVTDETSSTSNDGSSTIKVAKPATPSVSLWGTDVVGSSTVRLGAAATKVIESVTIDDADSETMSGAVVAVKNSITGSHISGDSLGYVAANGISVKSNVNGVLTLTGNATKAAYKAALESITFDATTGGGLVVPAIRTLSVALSDEYNLTGTQTMTIFVSLL